MVEEKKNKMEDINSTHQRFFSSHLNFESTSHRVCMHFFDWHLEASLT